jgi:glycosyltransferase involved in cell wall biosynthesis
MKIPASLVSTILNDRCGAEELLSDLCAQTEFPEEMVVVDGGSTDGTWEYLQSRVGDLPFNLRLIQESGANVSRGRNIAIEHASHEVILTTDFGCRLDDRWVEALLKPFFDGSIEIVTGSWRIRDEDVVTSAQWAEWALAGGKMEMVATPTCLASTRSLAFRKQVWEDFGRYPEDLTLAGDDAIFSMWMVAAKRQIAAAPEAICYWHRFPKLKSYLKEARRNFRGAGEAIFFLDFGVKTGALFVLEATSLVGLATAVAAIPFGASPAWSALAGGVFLVAWSKRFIRWGRAAAVLVHAGKLSVIPHVIALDVGVRAQGVIGFWQGYFAGRKQCRACRDRMAALGVPRW